MAKQRNGINKGWLHCLTSESRWRFLVNNTLMLGWLWAWYLVMAQIQFSLIKKKDWTSRTPPNPPTPYVWQHLIFVLPPPLPRKVDVIWGSHPKCQAESQSILSTSEKMRSPNMVSPFKHSPFKNKSLALREWNGFRTKIKHQIFIAYHSPKCLIIESI